MPNLTKFNYFTRNNLDPCFRDAIIVGDNFLRSDVPSESSYLLASSVGSSPRGGLRRRL